MSGLVSHDDDFSLGETFVYSHHVLQRYEKMD